MSNLSAYEEIIEFLARGTTPAEIVSFQPSPEARARVADLIEREKTSGLSDDERSELEEALHLEHLMRLTKARARELLGHGE